MDHQMVASVVLPPKGPQREETSTPECRRGRLSVCFTNQEFYGTWINLYLPSCWQTNLLAPSDLRIQLFSIIVLRDSVVDSLQAKGRKPWMAGLTFRSTRTPPALPSALSQHFAIPAPFSASVQAGPV